jgi:hypothetical protein
MDTSVQDARACSTQGTDKKYTILIGKHLNGRHYIADLEEDGRTKLKCIDWVNLVYDRVQRGSLMNTVMDLTGNFWTS